MCPGPGSTPTVARRGASRGSASPLSSLTPRTMSSLASTSTVRRRPASRARSLRSRRRAAAPARRGKRRPGNCRRRRRRSRLACGDQRDVVGEAAVEDVDLDPVGAVLPAQRDVDVAATLQALLRVAALVGGGGGMHAVGIQLVARRRAFGVGNVRRQLPLRRHVQHGADRRAARREAALLRRTELRTGTAGVAFGAHAHLLGAQACADVAGVAPGPPFQPERSRLAGVRRRHEGLFAQRREARRFELRAHRAFQAPGTQRQSPGARPRNAHRCRGS